MSLFDGDVVGETVGEAGGHFVEDAVEDTEGETVRNFVGDAVEVYFCWRCSWRS